MICLKKIERIIFFFLYWLVVNFVYSKVPNKRSATFINFRKIFQGIRSYLEGVRLLVSIKCFLKIRKVGFKIPNSMKIILFEEGGRLIWEKYAYCFYPNFQGVCLFGGLRLLGTLEYTPTGDFALFFKPLSPFFYILHCELI